jgi:RNA polymerase sigma-70 factor (ECF subfamily)
MKPGALKVALSRLRGRRRQLLRSEVADTVTQPQEVEEEIRYLLSLLGY